MEEPKVCLGCFAEWQEGKKECPYCEWSPNRVYSDMFGWKTGDVFEQRYLIGTVCLRFQDIAVWRAFDNLLRISCLILRKRGDSKEGLFEAARCLQTADDREENIEILAVKKIGGEEALIFSVADPHIKPETLRKRLERSLPGRKMAEDVDSFRAEGIQKEKALPPDTRIDDRYRILACIGIGGFGIIYLCEDEALHRRVALKEYFPEEWAWRDGEYVSVKSTQVVEAYRFGIQSFLKEVRITAQFIHIPHIVTIYDAVEVNDTVYMVMEYIEGKSIGREMRIRNYKPYTPEQMAEIFLPVLESLESIHEKRIVHSDISPGNIMRSKEGKIYLVDMGAAKYNLESQPVLSAAFLKPDYAAPEQYRTAKEGIPRDEGPWTDIYAAGATMYYLLTGHRPTDAISRLSGKTTKLVSPKKYKVRLKKEWMNLIHHAVELDKENRIHSVEEFREAIEKLLK